MLDMYFNGNARSTCNLDFNCQFSSSQLLKNAKKLSRYDLIVIGENRGMRTMLQFIREKDYSKWRSKDQLWAYFGVESSQRPTPYLLGAEKEYQVGRIIARFTPPHYIICCPAYFNLFFLIHQILLHLMKSYLKLIRIPIMPVQKAGPILMHLIKSYLKIIRIPIMPV